MRGGGGIICTLLPWVGSGYPPFVLYIFPRRVPSGSTHDLARTLLPLDLRGYYFISQGALAHL